MPTNRVSQLGYLGIDVRDVPAWQRFAANVLGLQSKGTDPDGTLFLRMDENHHRFALHSGGRDDLAYVGWETKDADSLRAITERLESQGVAITWGTTAEAQVRRVVGLIRLQDPSGIATEVCHWSNSSGLSIRRARLVDLKPAIWAWVTSWSVWMTTRRACASIATASV